MKRSNQRFASVVTAFAATFALLSFTFDANAAHIGIGTTDATVSWTNVGGTGSPAPESGEAGNRDESVMVNLNGIATGPPQTHNGANAENSTNSNLEQQTGGLLFDLGDSYLVNTMQIWNFNRVGFTDFGSSKFDLYISNDPTAVTLVNGQIQVADIGKFTQITNDTPLAEASGTGDYLGETFLFGTVSAPAEVGDQSGSADTLSASPFEAQYIFLDDLSGSDRFTTGRLGFSEVQFFEAQSLDAIVPESSSVVLALFAAIGCVLLLRGKWAK